MLFVDGEQMKSAQEVKYIGDMLNEKGRPKSTIYQRVSRGYAIVSHIFALLCDFPVGDLRVQIGVCTEACLADKWHYIHK